MSMRFLMATCTLTCILSCAPRVQEISSRDPGLIAKTQAEVPVYVPSPDIEVDAGSLHVKRPKQKIISKNSDALYTGSLFHDQNEANFLFTESIPQRIGQYLLVEVRPTQVAKEQGADQAKDTPAGEDVLEKELLAAVPELTPAAGEDVRLLKNFRMQIVEKLPNGDVTVEYKRTSVGQEGITSHIIRAKVPFNTLMSKDPISTADLVDVHFDEQTPQNIFSRSSVGWEDEYSLRMSGFTEQKSAYAIELEEKRKQLEEARSRLTTQIKGFAQERQRLNKERGELRRKAEELDKKVKDLEEKNNDQALTLKEKDEQLGELTSEQKL